LEPGTETEEKSPTDALLEKIQKDETHLTNTL
jgi:hypothetical protein